MLTFKTVKENNLKNLEAQIDSALIEYCPFGGTFIKVPLGYLPWRIADDLLLLKNLEKLGYNKEYIIEIIEEMHEEEDDQTTVTSYEKFLKFTPIKIDEA
jgi:hypothetical protein